MRWNSLFQWVNGLTHWGRVTHICVGNLTTIGSDNGLSPGRRQAIIWTNARILLIEPLGTNFSEIVIEILIFSFKKMRLKVSSAKWRPFLSRLQRVNEFDLLLCICVIWCLKTSSTLNQVMDCCLTIPKHYLNQCWLTINTLRPRQDGRHFSEDIFKGLFLN